MYDPLLTEREKQIIQEAKKQASNDTNRYVNNIAYIAMAVFLVGWIWDKL